MNTLILFATNLVDMFVSMAPYIMLGLLFVGILHSYIRKQTILKHLGHTSFWSVVKASIIGVPLPLCSCGVVPTAVQLKKDGASDGAVVSFLISTPQTGVDSILATYSLMGVVMAIYRPIAAFFSGIIGGGIVDMFVKKQQSSKTSNLTCSCHTHEHTAANNSQCCDSNTTTEQAENNDCCCSSHTHSGSDNCSCSSYDDSHKDTSSSCCTTHSHDSCGCGSSHCDTTPVGAKAKLKGVFTYAFGDFIDEIAMHFVVGLLIATAISTFIPTDFFVNLGLDSGILAMLAMIVIGLPMYICSTSSIPIAIALVGKGLSMGAAFVFLFVGPVTNIASLLILNKTLGKKITALYITCVVLCSIAFGLLLDLLINTFGLTILSVTGGSLHEDTSIFSYIVAIIFLVLIIKSLIKWIVIKCKRLKAK